MSILGIIYICCLCSIIVTAILNVIITKNMLKRYFVLVNDHIEYLTTINKNAMKEIVDMYEKKMSE